MKKAVLSCAVFLLIICSFSIGCAPSDSFDSKLDKIIEPYSFSILGWEIEALSYELEDFLFGGGDETADDSPIVLEYFSISRQKAN